MLIPFMLRKFEFGMAGDGERVTNGERPAQGFGEMGVVSFSWRRYR
jgi:hypothetical protein